jgi:hypothetical protein
MIELHGESKGEWLRKCLKLSNSIPPHGMFTRLFPVLNGAALQACFLSWLRSIATFTEGAW